MDEFIKKIILRNTIRAAFQRGNVYANYISQNEKVVLTDSIKAKLNELSIFYANNVTEQQHVKNIRNFAQTISQNHSEKLKNQKLRIGTAQKLLNVYIKFLWCLSEAQEPPHCPVDGIVLKEINDKRKWTDLDSIEDYEEIISKIRRHILNNATIANWEWTLWNERA